LSQNAYNWLINAYNKTSSLSVPIGGMYRINENFSDKGKFYEYSNDFRFLKKNLKIKIPPPPLLKLSQNAYQRAIDWSNYINLFKYDNIIYDNKLLDYQSQKLQECLQFVSKCL
jgi:hypothetical protein